MSTRQKVLELLQAEGRPLTARRIEAELSSRFHDIDEVSVNFAIHQLERSEEIEKVSIPGIRSTGWIFKVGNIVRNDVNIDQQSLGPIIVDSSSLQLHEWQERAWSAWREENHRGMIEAVTGSGKTVFAIECARRLAQQKRPLHTLVVVPTITLMYQWKESIERFAGNYFSRVGLLGDNHQDTFATCQIIVAVINSAYTRIEELLGHTHLGLVKSLLIADEVHRFQYAEQFQRVLEFPYHFTLGMSATLDHVEDSRLGRLFFSYRFKDARDDGLVPEFDMVNVAIPLNGLEQKEFEELSEQFQNQLNLVRTIYHEELRHVDGEWMFRRLRNLMDSQNPPDQTIKRLFSIMFLRTKISHVAVNKIGMAKRITSFLLSEAQRKSIIFFERIQSAIQVEDDAIKTAAEDVGRYVAQQSLGAWCKTMHSGLNRAERINTLNEFRRFNCAALLACRMLDEGLDVPEIDAAVLVSSTQTLRQRIQRIGRALRKSPSGRRPLIVTLYIPGTGDRNTTADDEHIFGEIANIVSTDIGNCMSTIRRIIAQ